MSKQQEEYQAVKAFLEIIYAENPALASAIGQDCFHQIAQHPLEKAINTLANKEADLDFIYQEMNLPIGHNAVQGTTPHKVILDIRLRSTGRVFVNDSKYGLFNPGPPLLRSQISPSFCPKGRNLLYYEYVWGNGLNYGVMETTDQDGRLAEPYRVIGVPFNGQRIGNVHFATLEEAIREAVRQACIAQCAKPFLSHPA